MTGAMLRVRRLALLAACALLALAVPLAPSGAGAAETCTTAIGSPQPDRPADAPLATTCAAAVLLVSPNPVDPGATVTLDGSQSVGGDAGDAIARYEWDFGDGRLDQTLPPDASVTHVYAAGRYTASLTIVNGSGTPLDSTTVELIVSHAPVAALDAPGGILRPGVSYDFDAGDSTNVDGAIAEYRWDWGDGTTQTTSGPSASHAFARDGASSAVSVTVVNDIGRASAPASAAVTVLNQLPLVQLIATPATVQLGEQLRLDATGTSDPDGNIAEYRWDLDANGSFETSTGTTPSVTAGGYPNPGQIVLKVKAIDDTGGASVKGVTVTVARPPSSGGGTGGGGGTGAGSGAGGAGGGSGAGGSGATGGSARDPFSVGLGGAAIQRLTAALRRGIGLQAVANRAASGTLRMTVSPQDAKRLGLPGRKGKRPVAIGTLRLALSAGRTAKPAIKLSAGAARALRRAKPRMLRVTIRGSLVAGADSAAVVRVVLLRG